MAITIKEVAKIAGVSPATVDKVLHDRPGVKEKTKLRIQQVIADLGYKPNIVGKALQLQKKKLTIAAILLKVDSLPVIQKGISDQLENYKDFGFHVEIEIIPYHDTKAQAQALLSCADRNISGVILHALVNDEVQGAINFLVEKKIPVITINSDIPESARSCFIGQNPIQAGKTAARLMAKFLSSRGSIVVFTGSRELSTDFDRLKGFFGLLQEEYPDMKVVETLQTWEDPLLTYQKTAELLNEHKKIDGFFISSGGVREVGRAVRALGFAGKIAIICFDLYEDIQTLIREKVIDCTIGQNLTRQGGYPVQLFFQYLYYNQPLPQGEIYTSTDIYILENIDAV
jgi:LacI family transcriptional regulator